MSHRFTHSLIAAVLGAAVCSGAVAADRAPRACFRAAEVNGFTAVDRDTVNVKVGVRDYYELQLMGNCTDIDWNMSVGLETRGSRWICAGPSADATILSRTPIGSDRCPVRSVQKISAEEVPALRSDHRP